MKKMFIVFLSILFVCLSFGAAQAEEDTLKFTWGQQEICPDFAGWHIYQSETSGDYGDVPAFDVPYVNKQEDYNATEMIISPDGEEHIYFFVMTAYDLKGNESIYSNECNATIDFLAPGIPFSLTVTVTPE